MHPGSSAGPLLHRPWARVNALLSASRNSYSFLSLHLCLEVKWDGTMEHVEAEEDSSAPFPATCSHVASVTSVCRARQRTHDMQEFSETQSECEAGGVWKPSPRALEMLVQGGRESWAPAVPFLPALPRSGANGRPSVLLNEGVPGSEMRTDESTLCGISTILVRIKPTCRYEPRNTNCDISMVPHME